MTAFNDLTGKTFGLWTVLRRGVNSDRGRANWVCQCACGTVKEAVMGVHLTGGRSTNCGCRRSQHATAAAAIAATTHGMYGTKTYWAWKAMWSRCTREYDASYKYYGGRGISVDPAWKSFQVFYDDMGEAPKGFSLERDRVNENYCKANCRWATLAEQAGNRTNTVRYARGAEVKRLTEWAVELGHSREYITYNSERLGLTRL